MLDEIPSRSAIPAYIQNVKAGRGKLIGFGHRVYKNYDPRAAMIKKIAEQVFGVTGHNPKLDIALELERIARQDEYFVARKLYPNADFYSGSIYRAIGFKPEMFTCHSAHSRLAGAVAGDDYRFRAEDHPAAPDLHRTAGAQAHCSSR